MLSNRPNDHAEISAPVTRLRATAPRLLQPVDGCAGTASSPPKNDTRRPGEARFREMFNAAATGIAITTPRGRFLQVNPAYCRMLGYTQSELLERDFACLTHPDDLARNLALRGEMLAGHSETFVMEKRYLKKNGDIVWARVSVSAAYEAAGEIATRFVIAEDITGRKTAERRLKRLSRLHAVLSKISNAVVRTPGRSELYEAACRIMVQTGLFRMALIAELDATTGLARPVASFGTGRRYLRETDDLRRPGSVIPLHADGLRLGTASTALQTGCQDVCNDIAGATRMAPWHEAAAKHGLLAEASFPLRPGGATEAVLVLYAAETDYFLDDEIGLLNAAADTLAFALESMSKEAQRQRAEILSGVCAAIVESSHDAIIVEDLHGVISTWNNGAEKIYGYTAEEVRGSSIMRLIPPDRREEEVQILRRIEHGESVASFDTMRRTRDGRLINLSITASPIKNAAGTVVGVSKVTRDITQARKLEARFRRLVESNAQAVFFWNRRGEITECNDAFLRLVGHDRADLAAGRIRWAAITPPEYADLDRVALDETAARGDCATYEKEFIRKDGSRVPILVGAAAFEDNPDEGVCFVLDLTERRKLEQQLRHAQKMEGIGNLAGGVAHDFNNLLAVIQMETDYLKGASGLTAGQLESADNIAATVQSAASLTRQLLLFSSRALFQPRDLDLSATVAETAKMLNRMIGADIRLQLKLAPGKMILNADPGMIDQILLNLVVNARDAMPHGGRLAIETSRVEIDALAVAQSPEARVGSFLCLSVSDDGSGIRPEILPNIFEPFFTTKDVGNGTGIGLATVFGIVHQHNGWITIDSADGDGTTVRIYLPQAR